MAVSPLVLISALLHAYVCWRVLPALPGATAWAWGLGLILAASALLMPLLGAVAAFGLARSGHVLIRAVIGMALAIVAVKAAVIFAIGIATRMNWRSALALGHHAPDHRDDPSGRGLGQGMAGATT